MSNPPDHRPRVAMVQDGARLHYAIPVALHHAGMLDKMFSEWYASPGSWSERFARLIRMVKKGEGQRMLDRYCPELPTECVISHAKLALTIRSKQKKFSKTQDFYEWSSSEVGKWVRSVGLGQANTLFGFVRNIDPGLCEWADQTGHHVVVDQIIAPAMVEWKEAQKQAERFADWAPIPTSKEYDQIDAIERKTWANASHITCGSDYVKRGLMELGVAESQISVLPYPIDVAHYNVPDRSGRDVVKIGFVGSVNLRKGAPYFVEIAKKCEGANVRFEMVGPIGISDMAKERAGGIVDLVGSVPRSEIAARLASFDLLLFPSTCEGSAGSVMEAMAMGLPIVTSPNSGSVVRHGLDGFIHPYDDIEELSNSVQELINHPDLRKQMGQSAREYVETYNLNWYSRTMSEVLLEVLRG